MILPILRWPDPRLTTRCSPVPEGVDMSTLAQDMLETMYAAGGRGLAAPQVGRLIRLFVMDLDWKSSPAAPVVMVNPQILSRASVEVDSPEGCLSIPGPITVLRRAESLRMRWHDQHGAAHEGELTGMAAICAQHEYDHLDGILTLDRLAPEARALAEAEVLPQSKEQV